MVVYFYPRSPCGERRVTVLGVQHRTGISIHALLAESDAPGTSVFRGWTLFLSTLSLRRATSTELTFPGFGIFLSTLSLRRATHPIGVPVTVIKISIHALLAESDAKCKKITKQQKNFYPRSPCGERLMDTFKLTNFVLFLSTLSLRRATFVQIIISGYARISIHALLAESDHGGKGKHDRHHHFYPRSPCGERH